MRADGEVVYGPPPLRSSPPPLPRSRDLTPAPAPASPATPVPKSVPIAPPVSPATNAELVISMDIAEEADAEPTATFAAPVPPLLLEAEAAAPSPPPAPTTATTPGSRMEMEMEIEIETEASATHAIPIDLSNLEPPRSSSAEASASAPVAPLAYGVPLNPPAVAPGRPIAVVTGRPDAPHPAPTTTDTIDPAPPRRAINLSQRRIRERSRSGDLDRRPIPDPRAALLYEEATKAVLHRDLVTAERHLALALSYMPNEPRLLEARDKVRRLRQGNVEPR